MISGPGLYVLATMPGSAVPTVVLVDVETGAVVARLEARVVDITLIGALARIQLLARRQGRRVRVRDASPSYAVCSSWPAWPG